MTTKIPVNRTYHSAGSAGYPARLPATAEFEGAIKRVFELGHALGNQHWKSVIKGTQVYVPFISRKENDEFRVENSVVTRNLNITLSPGETALPHLTPSESRLLFGGARRPHVHVMSACSAAIHSTATPTIDLTTHIIGNAHEHVNIDESHQLLRLIKSVAVRRLGSASGSIYFFMWCGIRYSGGIGPRCRELKSVC